MPWSSVAQWKDTTIGHRGTEYEEFKRQKADECIALTESVIPGLRESVERVYSSTPLTYRSYTNTENGSAYGIRKDCESPMTTILTPRTPIKNLLLTGQSLNLHGVLGVSMTTLFTVREIIDFKI
jgi:all-trans-retinol 13,14-reductase